MHSSPPTSSFSNVMRAERPPTRPAPATQTRPRRIRILTPKEAYRNSGVLTSIIFDLRVLDSAEQLHGECAARLERRTIEILDGTHCVSIMRPGLAWRSTS